MLKNRVFHRLAFGVLYSLLSSSLALADLQTLYGLGSWNSALVGANRTEAKEAFMASYNPATMSFVEKSLFSLGYQASHDSFKSIDNVVVSNEYIGGTSTTGNVDVDVEDTNAIYASGIFALGTTDKKFRMGFTFGMPLDKLVGVETQSTYQPQYTMYFADTQRIIMNTSASWLQRDNLAIGIGAHLFLVTGSTLRSILPASSGGEDRTSSIDMKLEVKLSVIPSFGMLYKWNKEHSTALTYFGERDADLVFSAKNDVNVLSSNPIPINFEGYSSLYYDPETISLSHSYASLKWSWYNTLDWERWSHFQSAVVRIKFESSTTFGQFPIDSQYSDILTFRTGFEIPSGEASWQLGYAYRPSPVPEPESNTNFLDSDKHLLGLGYSKKVQDPMGFFKDKIQMHLSLQGHYLVEKKVEKQDATDIGAPGYSIGGWVLAYGLSFGVPF